MNALTRRPPVSATIPFSRLFMSKRFLEFAAEYEALAAQSHCQGTGKALLLGQAALARQHAHNVLTEPMPKVVYLTALNPPQVTLHRFVFWQPGGDALCSPATYAIASKYAAAWIAAENAKGAGLHPKPVRFDLEGA